MRVEIETKACLIMFYSQGLKPGSFKPGSSCTASQRDNAAAEAHGIEKRYVCWNLSTARVQRFYLRATLSETTACSRSTGAAPGPGDGLLDLPPARGFWLIAITRDVHSFHDSAFRHAARRVLMFSLLVSQRTCQRSSPCHRGRACAAQLQVPRTVSGEKKDS